MNARVAPRRHLRRQPTQPGPGHQHVRRPPRLPRRPQLMPSPPGAAGTPTAPRISAAPGTRTGRKRGGGAGRAGRDSGGGHVLLPADVEVEGLQDGVVNSRADGISF